MAAVGRAVAAILGSVVVSASTVATGTPIAAPLAYAAPGGSRIAVQAHRGGPALGAPENSLAAFRLALAEGVDRIEFDVQFTKDKVAVINHDDKITDRPAHVSFGVTVPERDCTHDGSKIHSMTLAQVEQVRCGGEPIPTLAQVIDLVRGSAVDLNVEIKSWDQAKQTKASNQENATLVVRQLLAGGMAGKFVISTYVWRDIAQTVKKLDPNIYLIGFEYVDDPDGKGPAGFIRQPKSSQFPAVREAAKADLDAFGMNSNYAQASVLDFIGELGMDPALYELDTPQKVKFAVAHGQTYVGTDNPRAVKGLVAGFNGSGAWPTRADLPVQLTSLKEKKVYDKALASGKQANAQVIGKSGTAPAKAQKGLKGVRLNVTVKAKKDGGEILIGARNSNEATDVAVPIKNGTFTYSVFASPGDKGEVRIRSTGKADKVTVKVSGYEQYVLG